MYRSSGDVFDIRSCNARQGFKFKGRISSLSQIVGMGLNRSQAVEEHSPVGSRRLNAENNARCFSLIRICRLRQFVELRD